MRMPGAISLVVGDFQHRDRAFYLRLPPNRPAKDRPSLPERFNPLFQAPAVLFGQDQVAEIVFTDDKGLNPLPQHLRPAVGAVRAHPTGTRVFSPRPVVILVTTPVPKSLVTVQNLLRNMLVMCRVFK